MDNTAAARPKLWNSLYIRVGAITFAAQMGVQMLFSSFSIFLGARGFSSSQIGMLAGAYTLCTMTMRFFGGRFADTVGRRALGVLGLILFTIPLLGYRFWPAAMAIVLCRLLQGFGSSAITITTGTMAADVLHPARLTEGIGYYGLFGSAAGAIGPAIGLSLMEKPGGEHRFFETVICCMLLALALLATMNYEKKNPPQKKPASSEGAAGENVEEKVFFLWNFFEKKSMPAGAVMLLMSTACAAMSTFVSPFARSLHISGIGLFFTVQALFMFVMRIFSAQLAKKIGTLSTLLMGLASISASLLSLAAIQRMTGLLFSAVLMGVGGGLANPILNVLAVAEAPPHRRGKATSTFYAAFDIGAGGGALLWGLVIDWAGGYRACYIGAAAVMALGVLAALALFRRRLAGHSG